MLLVVGLCLSGAVVVFQNRAGLPRLMLQPSWLIALLVLDGLLLTFRFACVVDAYRLGASGPPGTALAPPQPTLAVAGLGLVLVATILPHAVVGYYDFQAYDLLTSVFPEQPGLEASSGSPEANGTSYSSYSSLPGRITILLVGGDAGPGRTGLRADTVIVASIQPASGRVVLFGLPRNLIRVPLPAGPGRAFGCRCFPRPLNELYTFAEEHPALFPGHGPPGVNALRGAAEQLLGIHIDYHAMVDLKGFVDVVNALGGVTIWITEPIHVEIDQLGAGPGGPAYELGTGRRHLDGLTALAYARSRKTTSDYDRMRRQRCLLGGLARQVDAGRMLRAFPSLVRVAKRDVSTDIPLDQLPNLVSAARRQRPRVKAIGFTPPDYVVGWASGGYPVPDVARIQQTVRTALRAPRPGAAPAATASKAAPAPSPQAPDPCRPIK